VYDSARLLQIRTFLIQALIRNMNQIEIGSTVKLKSGGPIMTVESYGTKLEAGRFVVKNVDDMEKVVCQWFEENTLQTGIFPIASLVVADDSPPL